MTTQLSFNSVVAIPTVQDLPVTERPAHRVREMGAQVCSTAELLAAIIGGKDALATAQRLLAQCESLTAIATASAYELSTVPGIGETTAARLKAALELGHRLNNLPPDRPTISSPADAANLLMPEMSSLDQEHLRVILVDTRNRVLAIAEVYKGSLNTTILRVGELFKEAVRRNACGIVVAHNHPSGDPSPSPEDVAVTRMVVEAGKLLDIEVLDHLVIGAGRFCSLKERGLGFT